MDAVRQRDLADRGAAIAHHVERRLERAHHVAIDPLAQQSPRHADANAAQVARGLGQRAREWRRRHAGGGRVERVVSRDHVHGERRVGHRRREGANLIQRGRERDQAVARHTPVRRLEPDDAAEPGGLPDRSAGIGAERQRHQPRRDSRGRSAAGSAGRSIERPGVAGRPERRVLRRRAHRELIAVRLADDDRAGRFETGHDRGIVGGDVAVEDPRARRGGDAARAHVVLEGDGDAEERKAGPVGSGVKLCRPRQRAVGDHRAERAERSVGGRDTIERGAADLDRGRAPRRDRPAHVGGRERKRHQPITRGTLNKPALTSASGRRGERGFPGQGRLHDVVAHRHAAAGRVRRRLDPGRVDALDLLRVGQNPGELPGEEIFLVGVEIEAGQARHALHVLAGESIGHRRMLSETVDDM